MTDIKTNDSRKKLGDLRAVLKKEGVDGFFVPHADEYQNEYSPDCAERLGWLTGFTGSAGFGVVLKDKAVVATDSRYTIQIKKQVDKGLYEIGDTTVTTPEQWVSGNASAGDVIGYDPKLHTVSEIENYKKALDEKGITLAALDNNPVDVVWSNRPAAPSSPVRAFDEKVAGRTFAEKLDLIAADVKKTGGTATILSKGDSVAWTLNIRGDDIHCNPFALSYLTVYEDGMADWFIGENRVPDDLVKHLSARVRICDPATLETSLDNMGKDAVSAGKPVLMDYGLLSVWFKNKIEAAGGAVKNMADPCIVPRACKTPEEQAAIIDAHVKDGVALVKFLAWLDKEAPKGRQTEITVADKLEEFRRASPALEGLSFDTIAGWNANGAIVHYRADDGPDGFIDVGEIKGDGMLLVDSGGQYSTGGTTDVTRTIAVGKPTDAMRRDFTNVLRGHIGVAMQKFPEGTTGATIDVLARKALWADGKDYGHGTGHGVGCNLAVHESGVGIHSRAGVFKSGMLVSNEPGFYKKDEYGIRIENLVLVEETGAVLDNGGSSKKLMLQFNTVTMAPIDNRLIEPKLMEKAELQWLNDYHDRVYKTLSPHLDRDVQKWLKKACKPLR